MAHHICGLIVDGAYDVVLAESLDLRPMLTYASLTLLPINQDWSAVQRALRGRTGTLDMPTDAEGLIPTDPRWAIIFTEYFGGVGEQCAAAFQGDRRLTSGTTINESLRALGVPNAPGVDEFATFGLGSVRHNPTYLSVYSERAKALGG